MHPDIIKFWADSGYEIEMLSPVNNGYDGEWRMLFYVKKGDEYGELAGVSEIMFGTVGDGDPKCSTYLLSGKWLTEEEMLKLIKLKAFL